ncbi:MAG: hypothetical protein M1822_009236 [Bathelium mastoideum]|nr:MAG: hypothetical protein M1822_009236 [Bathelium mastoideum]
MSIPIPPKQSSPTIQKAIEENKAKIQETQEWLESQKRYFDSSALEEGGQVSKSLDEFLQKNAAKQKELEDCKKKAKACEELLKEARSISQTREERLKEELQQLEGEREAWGTDSQKASMVAR